MTFTELYQVDGVPLLAPDADVTLSFSDLDSADSGRDESGVMHRIVVRQRVATWEFCYSVLTAQEYRYMQELFANKPEFTFTYPMPDGTAGQVTAYCSGGSLTYHNASVGLYRNLKIKIIQC